MEKNRWDNYRKACNQFPKVRENEIKLMIKKINPKSKDIIVEVGTGNGALTFPIAKKIKKLITYDVTETNLQEVKRKNKKFKLPIVIKKQKNSYQLNEPKESVDKVISIATFHHYDDKSKKTGFSGRIKILKEFNRILKKGGKLIIGDVGKNTVSARYFDSINNPKYCYPTGHPHDFLSKEDIKKICKITGFEIESYNLIRVPWVFNSEKQAKEFLHTIHNAKCSEEESLEHAKEYLKFWKRKNKYLLDWELFYLIARKT